MPAPLEEGAAGFESEGAVAALRDRVGSMKPANLTADPAAMGVLATDRPPGAALPLALAVAGLRVVGPMAVGGLVEADPPAGAAVVRRSCPALVENIARACYVLLMTMRAGSRLALSAHKKPRVRLPLHLPLPVCRN